MEKDTILDAIAAKMRTGVLVVDAGGRVIYANPFLLKSFPASDGITGHPVDEMIHNAELLETIKRCVGDPCASAGDIEYSEAGRSFKVEINRVTGDGETNLLVFLRDITEEKRVETIKKDFVANLSHELRTPLASIKGYSETLLDGGVEDVGTRRDFLRVIDRHATRMSRLIDDLLILSRLESQEEPAPAGSVDLGELIAAVAAGVEKQASDKNIDVTTDVPDDLPAVAGDKDRVEQVVVNLLDNAIKYTPGGGSVVVSAASAGGEVRVDVLDTGIGIPAGDIPRIFERFYRVDKARSRELGGTGLGLAIVKHIVQGLDGKLSVESEPGKGSRFSFTLKKSG
ncbi:MAG: ATP-binding protein [Thermodesulfobacteriota bacterium]